MKNILFILSLLLFVTSSCNKQEKVKEEEPSYLATLPQIKDTIIEQEYIGQVRAIQHIELRAIEEGYLQKIYVDEGQKVRKGQLIFQILPIVYQAEVQKSRAEVQYAKTEYQNTKMLADSNIVSKNELALIKSKYDKAKAELSLADAHLGFTRIVAPFDGIVGRFNDIRTGSLLEGGELLSTLSDNSKMWVYFNVPESQYLSYVAEKSTNEGMQKVQLKMANDMFYELPGKVETIEADFNNETGNIAFRATFQNPKSILRHGQTGKIFIPTVVKKAMLIPQEATYEILDKKYVYIIKNGKVQAKHIEINNELPHLYVVSKGISASDTILVEGLRKVKNGEFVKPKFKKQDDIIKSLTTLQAE